MASSMAQQSYDMFVWIHKEAVDHSPSAASTYTPESNYDRDHGQEMQILADNAMLLDEQEMSDTAWMDEMEEISHATLGGSPLTQTDDGAELGMRSLHIDAAENSTAGTQQTSYTAQATSGPSTTLPRGESVPAASFQQSYQQPSVYPPYGSQYPSYTNHAAVPVGQQYYPLLPGQPYFQNVMHPAGFFVTPLGLPMAMPQPQPPVYIMPDGYGQIPWSVNGYTVLPWQMQTPQAQQHTLPPVGLNPGSHSGTSSAQVLPQRVEPMQWQPQNVPMFASSASQAIQTSTGDHVHTTAPPVPQTIQTSMDEHQQPQVTAGQRSPTRSEASSAQGRAQRQGPRLAAARQRHVTNDARPILPRNARNTSASTEMRSGRGNTGGRHGPLTQQGSHEANCMRKFGNCWPCILVHMKCSPEEICRRCTTLDPNNPLICNRQKLQELIGWFLPGSVTMIHQRDSFENALRADSIGRRPTNTFELLITPGFGPPQVYRVCEFVPKTPAVLVQYQYFEDPITRRMMRYPKYSPPLIITNLESEHKRFSDYINTLFTEEHLMDFSEMCYASESRHDRFQQDLLALLCKLYLAHDTRTKAQMRSKHDVDVKTLLKKIIRMLILTYIMGHTMTIVEETLPDVMQRVPSPPDGCSQYDLPWARGRKQISPRLTNRQLKLYFCVLREDIYKQLLRDLQKLMAANNKDQTWMAAFCCMLGFAMVLEEVQCSLQIQADAKTYDEGWDVERARSEAIGACELIDQKYDLLLILFQRKYRDAKWITPGPFANQTPQVDHPAEQDFLDNLRQLVWRSKNHLVSRKDVELGHEYQCLYTSRLVAKFLLPFTSLPP